MDETAVLLKEIEEKAERWGKVVAPIFGDSTKKFVSATGFGTGFLATFENNMFFVTADHVFEDFEKYSAIVTNIAGMAFDLSLLKFVRDRDHDLAFAPITDSHLKLLGLPSINYCQIDRDWTNWTPYGIFIAMGYPASKNQLKLKFKSTDRNGFSIFATGSEIRPKKTELTSYMSLHYDPKNIIRSSGERLNPPKLKGMSGGPCFEVMSQQSDGNLAYSFRIAGLISEFHSAERAILISSIDEIRH